MIILEYSIVALVLALALIYLFKAFRPKSKPGGCGCQSSNCKVPKPKLKR